MRKKSLCLLGVLAIACGSAALADEEVLVKLRGVEDYGSGPSVLDNLYTPGGVVQIGLFLGNPNNLVRRDRVLLKYDIKPLLLSADRVKSAELVFYIDYVTGPEETREVRLQHFTAPVGTLAGPTVNSADVEEVTVVEVSEKEAVNGGSGATAGQPKEIDVTEALKSSLARGDTSCAFRLEDVLVEKTGPSPEPAGVIIVGNEAKRPVLRVVLND